MSFLSYFTAKEKVILKLRYQPFDDLRQKINKLLKSRTKLSKIYKIIKTSLNNIPQDVIVLFYNEPNQFFLEHLYLLKNTSYYDERGNSIFAHYFYILYSISTNKNNIINPEIYESNFDSFFEMHKKYISILDLCLESPLHKLAKMNNKIFFLKIYKRLKKIDVIDEKIITMENVKRESCFDLIVKEIETNRKKIILDGNHELFNFFITENNAIVNLLPIKIKTELKLFSLKLYFDTECFKDIKFEAMYNGIKVLLENVKDQINEYFNPSINYLNCLYNYSKSDGNLEKLYILISDLLNKTSEEKNNNQSINSIPIELYIFNHLCYVLTKMNDKSVIYCKKLIKNILPILLNKYPYDEYKHNLKSGRSKYQQFKNNSLVNNLALNTNISFNQKCEVFKCLEEELQEHFEEDTDNDIICIYNIYKLYKKKLINKSSITSYFKKYEYIRKIFADFFFIGKLYRKIYYLCSKYDKIHLKNYIQKLNNFVKNNKEIFIIYKARYSLQDKNIDTIIKIIILFEKQNYNTDLEEEYFERKIIVYNNENNAVFEKLYKKFILAEPKLILYTIKEIILNSEKSSRLKKKNLYSEFLDLFFSFKCELKQLLLNKNFIPYFSNKNDEEFKIYDKKLKINLPLIKGRKDEFFIYKFILKYSPNINNKFIFGNVIREFARLMKYYLKKLIINWKDDLDFSELSNFIDANILIFCKLFFNLKDTLIDRRNKINFFFDEFIYVLNPEFKEKFVNYKQISLDYLNFKDEDEEYFYDIDSKLYLSMMLIFIRLKFGKYDFNLLYDFFENNGYIPSYDIFLFFLKAYFNNENKKDILYHYFLIDDELSSLYPDKYTFYFKNLINYHHSIIQKIFIFFSYSQSRLKHIEYSLIYEFIKSFYPYDGKSIQLLKYKYIFAGISIDQNKELFNLINDKLIEENDFSEFFYFFNKEPLLNNEENIKHKIKNLKQISLYLEEKKELIKNKEISNLEINKFVIYNTFYKSIKKRK